MKHFVCKKCGNLIAMINDSGKIVDCCSSKMNEVVPNATEASKEKHTPTIEKQGNKITVSIGIGDNAHPMEKDHAITWVCLVTDNGSQRKLLSPLGHAKAVFYIADNEKVIKAFAYCNLHGLWVSECKDCK